MGAATSVGPEPTSSAGSGSTQSNLSQLGSPPHTRSALYLSRASPGLIALGGGLIVVSAGYLAAAHPRLSHGRTTLVWVALAASLVALALYASASGSWTRPGRVLAPISMLWALCLLLASAHPVAFSLGWLLVGVTVSLVAYAMLTSAAAGPFLRSERLLLLVSSLLVAISWGYLALTSRQPMLVIPLSKCVPACPRNVFFAGSALDVPATIARETLRLAWLAAALGVAVCIGRRYRAAGRAVRRRLSPILVLAIAYALAVGVSVGLMLAGWDIHAPLVWVSVTAATMLPLAMLAGLVWERLFMGEALEEFVNSLVDTAPDDLPALMAHVMHDPSVQIGYAQPAANGYVDPSGASVELPRRDADQEVTPVERERLSEAVVIHRDAVPDEARFIRAAGAAALMSYENHRLEADLSASVVELAASRKRLVDAANVERQRIERDLHDGIQQRIVGARVRLELADEALDSNPARGRRMMAEIGCDLDDALEEVRSLAQGVYPALLETHGLIQALRSAARRSPGPVTVRGEVSRYPPDTEAAVYFCCLETLQNVAKHAGRGATATLRLWEDGPTLHFQTEDTGVGFRPNGTRGHGLVNMRDRLAAVGGTLTLSSRDGAGTVVRGSIPLA
jgi:signal transduction histidine kinase